MAQDRAREVRIAVEVDSSATVNAVRKRVFEVLGDGWHVRRLERGSRIMMVTGHTHDPVGTAAHAAASHRAALALVDQGSFRRVEADVPVHAFVDPAPPVGAFGDDDCEDESKVLDWTHRLLRWQQAMDLMTTATRGGAGIRIGHPDSGYTVHPNLGVAALDLKTDRDVIDGDDDALDDLHPNPRWPVPNPGHGTATASVIVGRGSAAAGVVGIAPAAILVPIRATESVIQFFDSDVARAVAHARRVGCHVVSMSLGGKGFFGLKSEIQKAVDSGMIVMAAAGNYVRIVTAPASYGNCLAVAATGPRDRRWSGSSRGGAVDVSMPGTCVHHAGFTNGQPKVNRGHGTSYAVAHLAGAAALWLAHHGHGSIVQRVGVKRVQAAFLSVLRWPVVCVVPAGWNDDWGIGRVDLPNLLQAPLPTSADLDDVGAFGVTEHGPAERIGAALGVEPVLVRARLAALLGATDQSEIPALLARHEGELVYLAMTDPSFMTAVADPAAVGAFGNSIDVEGVSGELAARLA